MNNYNCIITIKKKRNFFIETLRRNFTIELIYCLENLE